ncbi:MAG: hypothetical protein EOM30_03270 [Clostridia bacterium]|nr:hypothetical protein [Clostridia bacterium]NLS85586.1 hypothetical protein [Oscillospiraceae bacterium]
MSNKIRVEINRAGVRELLRSQEISAICEARAQAISARCGRGYEVSTYTGKNRANASVHAATPKARRDNIKNNTILKATR